MLLSILDEFSLELAEQGHFCLFYVLLYSNELMIQLIGLKNIPESWILMS